MFRIGADTSYFFYLAQQQPRAMQIWQDVLDGKVQMVISTITINEYFLYYFRRGLPNAAAKWLESLLNLPVEVTPVSAQIAIRSAHFRHSLGLSTADAIILATSVEHNCDQMITADSDFKVAVQQNIFPIEFLIP